MRAVVTLFFDKRRKSKKSELYPLRIRVTHDSRQHHVKIMELSEEDWNKLNKKRVPKSHTIIDQEVKKHRRRAEKIVEGIKPFSWPVFKKAWNRDVVDRTDLIGQIEQRMLDLDKQGQYGTSNSFRSTLSAVKKFHSDSSSSEYLQFTSVDADWLEDFESWMLDQGKSRTTIGIYARNIRTIFNSQIKLGDLDRKFYPFGEGKYVIPNSKNVKKALSDTDLKKLFEYHPEHEAAERALNFWKLIYLCSGINVKDLALLKHENLHQDEIRFFRAKTKKTSKGDQVEIRIPLIDEAKKLISTLKVRKSANGGLLFDLIDHKVDSRHQHQQVLQASKTINKHMDRIRLELGFPFKVRTYEARHSFGSKLYKSGVSIDRIQEAMGHKNLKTTKAYLASIDIEERKTSQKKLMDF